MFLICCLIFCLGREESDSHLEYLAESGKTHTRTHTRTHTYTHTYTYIHTHTQTHTSICKGRMIWPKVTKVTAGLYCIYMLSYRGCLMFIMSPGQLQQTGGVCLL